MIWEMTEQADRESETGKTAAGTDHAYAYKKMSSWYGSLCIQTNSV